MITALAFQLNSLLPPSLPPPSGGCSISCLTRQSGCFLGSAQLNPVSHCVWVMAVLRRRKKDDPGCFVQLPVSRICPWKVHLFSCPQGVPFSPSSPPPALSVLGPSSPSPPSTLSCTSNHSKEKPFFRVCTLDQEPEPPESTHTHTTNRSRQ